MSVRISEIDVKNYGPLEKFSFKPGLLNLVYGRNEKGKTCLVEFLVRSLFRNAKEWELRPLQGAGKVLVEGLGGKTNLFSPAAGKKMEDFWEEVGAGLPADFSRLLAVKGAEPSLSENGVDRAVLKNLLSGMDVLDIIQNRISKTVQGARIEGGIIIGDNKGEIKTKKELEEKLKGINVLFSQIDKGYSGGGRKILSDRMEKIQAELVLLDRARRHQAFGIAEAINELERNKNRIDVEKLKTLRQMLHLFQQKAAEIERKSKIQAGAEKRSEHYEWIRNAVTRYREVANQTAEKPRLLFAVLSLLLAAASVACMLAQWNIAAAVLLGCAILIGFLYVRGLHSAAGKVFNIEELNGLKQEYQDRFGKKLSGLPNLEETLQKIEPDFSENKILKKQIADEAREIDRLRQDIASLFAEFGVEAGTPDSWTIELKRNEERLDSLRKQIEEKKIRFAKLGVDEADYEPNPPEMEWDERRSRELLKQASDIQNELDDNTRKLDSLKQMICAQTSDPITAQWPELIQHLTFRREETLRAYVDLQADMAGKIALLQVLESARKGEDAKIEDGLNSRTVLNALGKVTGRYRSLKLQGDRLTVGDAYQEFGLSDLSTGAREQVLLSLRIGFAARLLKQDSLFLIFDDAFQYSDWERRGYLVDTVVGLAKQGWQIFYFTMDDHIRDLFDQKGKEFGKEYVKTELK